MKVDRRSFLQLMAGAVVTGPAAAARAIADPPQPLPLNTGDNPLRHWMLTRDHFVWMLTDDLTIEPGQVTNELLFQPPIPWGLTLHSVGWGWREDTKLADCRKLLGLGEHDRYEPSPARGMWLELMNDGRSVFNMEAAHFNSGFGLHRPALPPLSKPTLEKAIVPTGKFSLQVETPALDLSAPVALSFWLHGTIALEDWGMGGVKVPSA